MCLTLRNPIWTVAHQVPLSMEFSRQEYSSGLPFPTPGDLPVPRIEPMSLVSPALASGFFTTGPLGKPFNNEEKKNIIQNNFTDTKFKT